MNTNTTPFFDFDSTLAKLKNLASEVTPPQSDTATSSASSAAFDQAEPLSVPLSVSELTQQVQTHMESQFESVWVVGQISNLTYHRSGHIYLTLKDAGSQLPAIVWKSSASRIKFTLKDGMEIVCRGRLSVYVPHGKYQLLIEDLQPKGIGPLELAFLQLRDKLASEGLFDSARKRRLQHSIRRVAVITSPSGAAVKDFLQILTRRTKLIDVLILPAKVQGDGAAAEIASAIRRVNQLNTQSNIDCIVLTRGGGSMEDLWAFNEEVLVRSVAASAIPIVSAVGHEVDVTLCDFAADVRAATPSEAAERISREDTDRHRELRQTHRRLNDLIERRLRIASERLHSLVQHPILRRPEQVLEGRRYMLGLQEERLDRLMTSRMRLLRDHLSKIAASLNALSPLSILGRGYTLTENVEGRVIRRADDLQAGDLIRTRFADGVVESRCVD